MTPRVLMILEGWGLGGTERYVERLCRYLKHHVAADVTLALLTPPRADALYEIEGVVQEILYPDRTSRGRGGTLKQLLGNRTFDVAHLHLYSSLLPVSWRLRDKLPTVATFHIPLSDWGLRHRIGWRLSTRFVDRVVGVSHDVVDSLGFQGRGDVISGHIPCPSAQWQPHGKSTIDEPFQIIGVGRLSPQKDWPTLIKAVAHANKLGGRPVAARIIGDGDEQQRLDSLIRELDATNHVQLAGPRDPDKVLDELITADLFVLPSRFEGLGLAPLEAMAAGVPTITSDFPAAREFIDHGHSGHRFPIGDSTKLAELIRWHRDHAQESAAIGQRGRTVVVEQFSEENTVARYAEIYASLAGAPCQGVRQ